MLFARKQDNSGGGVDERLIRRHKPAGQPSGANPDNWWKIHLHSEPVVQQDKQLLSETLPSEFMCVEPIKPAWGCIFG